MVELVIKNLNAGYGAVNVLSNVSIDVPDGKTVALLGTNGNGKSTLMRCISGLIKPTAGSIELREEDGSVIDLTEATPQEIVDAGVAQVPEGRRLFDLKLSGAGLALCGASSPEDQTLIESVLAALDPADPRPDRFAREFLKAKGVHHVDNVFDSFDPAVAHRLAAE